MLSALLLGILNGAIVAAIFVLVGAIVVWICGLFQYPVPWTIQRIYLLICLLIFLYYVISALLGAAPVGPFHGRVW